MGRIRIADLPTLDNVMPADYLIVEKPGYQEGTFKALLGNIQKATTVTAEVVTEGLTSTIKIDDINGHTEASIVTPTAKIVDNGDNTSTITITDTFGHSESTVVNKVILDPTPTEGSPNLVNSGSIFDALHERDVLIAQLQQSVADLSQQIEYIKQHYLYYDDETTD